MENERLYTNEVAIVAALNTARKYQRLTSDNLRDIIDLRDMIHALLFLDVREFEELHKESLQKEYLRICNLLRYGNEADVK